MGLMQKFKREVRNCIGKPLAYQMREGFGASLSVVLERVARGHRVHDGEIKEFFGQHLASEEDEGAQGKHVQIVAGPQLMPSSKPGKYTAIVPLQGVALYDFDYPPYCFSTRLLAQTMGSLANDPSVDTIVLIVDTPGGSVTGTAEAGDAVFAARKRKKVTAIVDPLCASAGYWIASQATSIIAVPSADIGSVGVFMMHNDCSAMLADAGIKPTFIYAGEYKVEGNSYEPLSADAKAYYQSEVDTIYNDFINAVARGRGVKPEDVLANYGKGRCLSAKDAKKAGMIDEIMVINTALMSCGVQMAPPSDDARRRSEADTTDKIAQAAEAPVVGSEQSVDTQVDVLPMTDEGCSAITFRRDEFDGAVYGLTEWPARTALSVEFISNCKEIGIAGETITIAVANGAAVYTKLGEAADGVWICGLNNGAAFSPPPPAPPSLAERAASVRRRRLAIEAHI